MTDPRRYRREEWLDIRPFWIPDTAGPQVLLQGPCVLVAVVTADAPLIQFTVRDGVDATGRIVWQSTRAASGRSWWARLESGLWVSGGGQAVTIIAAPLSAEAAREAARYR